jgi:hypothetical protein
MVSLRFAAALAAVGLFASGMVFSPRERSLTTHRSRISPTRPASSTLPLPNRPSKKAIIRTSLLSPTTRSENRREEGLSNEFECSCLVASKVSNSTLYLREVTMVLHVPPGLAHWAQIAERYSQPRSPNVERSTPGAAYHPPER